MQQPALFSVASSRRSSEVEAVIASLKNETRTTTPSSSYYSLEGPDHKRLKIAEKDVDAPTTTLERMDQLLLPTTLEDAISFSPFARVLFCAHAPHTIVHTNAAYITLAQKASLVDDATKPCCTVGKSFASSTNKNERLIEAKNPKEYISIMVAEHVGTLKLEKGGDGNVKNGYGTAATTKGNESTTSSSSQSRELQSSGSFVVGSHHVKIFPVVSNDEACSMFVRSYEKHNLQLKRIGTSPTLGGDGDDNDETIVGRRSTSFSSSRCNGDNGMSASFQDVSSSFGDSSSGGSSQHVSHYLLQIEPR